MSVNVLVTGANSTVAQSIIKALKASPLDVRIFGTDINPFSPGLYRVHEAFLVKPYRDPGYEAQMLELMRGRRIDVMLPAVEGELQQLAERRAAWEDATGTRIIVNTSALLDVTQDKYRTACFLAEHGCNAPASTVDTRPTALADFAARVGFPLIVKPRRGATSRHVHVVNTLPELLDVVARVPGPVVQEHLGTAEEEYTCGVFVDRHGTLQGVATLRREIANGITSTAVVEPVPDVEAEVARIVAALKPRASCNVQLRRNRDGRPTAFEVNARFSSSVAIRAHFGFNEVEATIRSFVLGEEIKPLTCRPGIAMRYVNEVYADAADVATLMSRGQHVTMGTVEANF
jgi:carbamoyl-phosphate synthase large subunit